jgi:hypothetical protein
MEGGQLKQDEKLPKVNSYIICEVNFSKVILWAENIDWQWDGYPKG